MCVSTPVPKGSDVYKQGARRLISHPCQRSYGNQLEESWAAGSCTCNETVDHAVQSFGLIHGFSCDPPPETRLPPQLSAACELQPVVREFDH